MVLPEDRAEPRLLMPTHEYSRASSRLPDDLDAHLVLPAEQTYTKEGTSAAEIASRSILEARGNNLRLF
jgi:hypothetical protein